MSSRRRKLLRCLSASFREQLQEYVRQEFDSSRIMRMATKCSLFRSYSLKQSTMTISTRAPRYNDTNQALLLLESLVHSCHWWILDFQSLTFSCYSYFLLFLSFSHHSCVYFTHGPVRNCFPCAGWDPLHCLARTRRHLMSLKFPTLFLTGGHYYEVNNSTAFSATVEALTILCHCLSLMWTHQPNWWPLSCSFVCLFLWLQATVMIPGCQTVNIHPGFATAQEVPQHETSHILESVGCSSATREKRHSSTPAQFPEREKKMNIKEKQELSGSL